MATTLRSRESIQVPQTKLTLRLQVERLTLPVALVVGLLHGIFYVFYMPPWQHYDEPNHFEYVWLVAHRQTMPHPGDEDPQLVVRVFDSMVAHKFFDPNTDYSSIPVELPVYSQLDDPPLYYYLASLPLRLLKNSTVEAELYAARLVSLLLFLLVVFVGWGFARDLFPPNHPLRWMMPLSLVLLPGFIEFMTAVNNDVLAITVFSFFLWGSIRFIRRASLPNLFWILVAGMLCLFTKSTVYIALPLLPLVLLLGVVPSTAQKYVWSFLGVLLMVSLLFVFEWGNAASWYPGYERYTETRAKFPPAPSGDAVFQVSYPASGSFTGYSYQLRQQLPIDTAQSLFGETITLGGWVWASRPIDITGPMLQIYGNGSVKNFSSPISLGTSPAFYSFTTEVDHFGSRAWVVLTSVGKAEEEPVTIYYDGVVLVPGERSSETPPVFDSGYSKSGLWDGSYFANLLRNASAESSWPRFRPWVQQATGKVFDNIGSNNPTTILYTLLDLPTTHWYYKSELYNLGRTFYAKFGWGQVYLLGHQPYRPLGWLTYLALFSAVIALLHRREVSWQALLLFGIVILILWGLALARGAGDLLYPRNIYYPPARYVLPAVLPMLLILNLGWLEVGRWLQQKAHVPSSVLAVLFVGAWLFLDIYSIYSIWHYYNV